LTSGTNEKGKNEEEGRKERNRGKEEIKERYISVR
jgi:hypothetical protein